MQKNNLSRIYFTMGLDPRTAFQTFQ